MRQQSESFVVLLGSCSHPYCCWRQLEPWLICAAVDFHVSVLTTVTAEVHFFRMCYLNC